MNTDNLKFLTDAFTTLIHSPAWFIIAAVLMIIGLFAHSSRFVPNKLIWVIYLVLGSVLYPLLGDQTVIPTTQRHPTVLMILLGIILGFGSYIAHFGVYKGLGRFFPPGFFPPEDLVDGDDSKPNSNITDKKP